MAVRTDNAPELVKVVETWNMEHGVKHQATVPRESWQNVVSERALQTSQDAMRALLKDSGLPHVFWDEAVKAQMYIRNRIQAPEGAAHSVTPEEAWSGKRPDVSHLRVWGCKTYSYVDSKSVPDATKLTDRGRIGVFVGYEENTTKHFRIYAPDLGYVIRASIVKFDESVRGGEIDLKLRMKSEPPGLKERRSRGRPAKKIPGNLGATGVEMQPPEHSHHPDTAGKPETRQTEQAVQTDFQSEGPIREAEEQYPRGTKRGREDGDIADDEREAKRLEYAQFLECLHQVFTASLDRTPVPRNTIPIPKTYEEAVNHPKWGPYWRKAAHAELRQLISQGNISEREAN